MRISYRHIFTLIAIAAISACSLDEEPKDQIEESQVYTSADALLRNTVSALYSNIGGNTDGQGLQGTCRGVYDLQTFGSDEAMLPTRGVDWYDGGIWQALYKHTWNAGHEVVKNAWNYLYKGIAMCNRAIETIEKNQHLLLEVEKTNAIAEARAIRAVYYFYLLDLYGRVPIITNTETSIENVTQSERSKVFEFVREELETVIGSLPDRYSTEKGAFYGRVTAPVAAFLLAKLYLNAEVYADDAWTDNSRPDGKTMTFNVRGEKKNAWEACIYYCNLLKDMGYELESKYTNNFSVDNEKSKENIWAIPMDRNLFTNQQQNMFRSYHWRHADALGFAGENGTSATMTVLKANRYGAFDQDARFSYNYWYGQVYDNHGFVVYDRAGAPLIYQPLVVEIDLNYSQWMETAGARMKKYEIDIDANEGGKLMDNDIVLFRYADVLLMWAEALVRNGESGQTYFGMVRDRADMPSRICTLDNIYEERLIELAWEGWRRNDMVRFDRYKTEWDDPEAPDETDHHTIVYPIPAATLDLNHYLTQNPGY